MRPGLDEMRAVHRVSVLEVLRALRAPLTALAGLLLLVNLLLPTALQAGVDRDAFGAPICAGFVDDGEGAPAWCNKCCPAALTALPPAPVSVPVSQHMETAPLFGPVDASASRPAALPAPARGPPSTV